MRHVHVERIGEVEPRQHRIARRQRDDILVGELDGDVTVLGAQHAGERGIEHAARLVIGGPADALALMQGDVGFGGELQPLDGDARIDLGGLEAVAPAIALDLDLAIGKGAGDLEGAAPQRHFGNVARHMQRLAFLVGMGVAQLLARGIDALIDADRLAAAGQHPFLAQARLDVGVDRLAGDAARSEDGGHLSLGRGQVQPALGGMRGGIFPLGLDHLVAEHAQRLRCLADIGEGGDRAQRVGALADILVHARGRGTARLQHGERLAGVDRGELLAIADQRQPVDAQCLGDPDQLQHVGARHHRGLVDGDDGVLQLVAAQPGGGTVGFGEETLIGPDEGRDRLRLDAGSLLQVGDHLVLEGEAQHLASLRLGDARDRLEHGRLAGTRDALDDDDAVLAGDDHGGGRELAGVEFMR